MNKSACLLFFICLGCAKKPGQPALEVSVVNANTITIQNTDDNLLANTSQDTIPNQQWQALLPVYRMPADTDMKDYQNPQPGKYAIKNNAVIFAADTPFKKGQTYFARFYHFQDDSNSWTLLKGDWKQHTSQYRECVFTP